MTRQLSEISAHDIWTEIANHLSGPAMEYWAGIGKHGWNEYASRIQREEATRDEIIAEIEAEAMNVPDVP